MARSLIRRIMDSVATNAVHFGIGYWSSRMGFTDLSRSMRIAEASLDQARGFAGIPRKSRNRDNFSRR